MGCCLRGNIFILFLLTGYAYAEVSDSLTGTLIISSTPSEAKAYIDDVYQGTTMLTIEGFKLGKRYYFRLEKEGYKPYSDSIIFHTPGTQEKNIMLSKEEAGTLIVSSAPSGAKVYIDNVYQGETPLTIEGLELKKKYELRVEKENCEPYCDTIIFETPMTLEKDIVIAEKEDIMEIACDQAYLDAKMDVNSALWLGAGCLGGLTGLIIASIYEPRPPLTRLISKSPEYTAYYTECYIKEVKHIQTTNATTGCVVSVAAGAACCLLPNIHIPF